jgi:PilZ domain
MLAENFIKEHSMEFQGLPESATHDSDAESYWQSSQISYGSVQIHVSVVDVLSDYAVAGVLHGFMPGAVTVLVSEPLTEQRTVAVHLSTFVFEGEILYCGQHESQYEVHISIDDLEGSGRRKAPRFPVTIPAELLRPSGDPVAITIRDLSRDGMGIESPVPLIAGQPIAIVSGPAFIFAVVRHSRELPGGIFRAGVEMHHLFDRPRQQPLKPVRIKWTKWLAKALRGTGSHAIGLAQWQDPPSSR